MDGLTVSVSGRTGETLSQLFHHFWPSAATASGGAAWSSSEFDCPSRDVLLWKNAHTFDLVKEEALDVLVLGTIEAVEYSAL